MFPRVLKTALWAALLALVVLVRCWNAADVFVAGRTFFVDPDCYSRMTRVKMVLEHPGTVVREHAFENWPEGTRPHTTAPFDYLTAGLAAVLPGDGALDRAGAWISPLLGLALAAFLWFWAGRLGLPYRVPMLLFFAVSPILVQGTVLGRPDHQSLVLLCLGVALGAQSALLSGKPSRGWALCGGLAWGLGLWVSLYEPLILGLAALAWWTAAGGRLPWKERLWFWLPLAGVVAVALVVQKGRLFALPGAAVRDSFVNWSRTVGELARVPLPTFFQWLGVLLLLIPALAWRGWRKEGRDRLARFWFGLLLALLPLTWWQARWGYFLALAFAMALPSLLAVFTRKRIAWALFVLALWPVGLHWKAQSGPVQAGFRAEKRADNLALYDVARQLKGPRRLPVAAPWWQSPALAYWSGQPCVAGSSHESLPGTVDVSRFYLCADEAEAEAILARRRVACVVAYEPERVNAVSAAILGKPAGEGTLGEYLYRRPHSAPAFLELAYSNAAFRVFVRPAGIEP